MANMIINRAIGVMLQPIWRARRGLTLGAQGIVVDSSNRILLVRHGYRSGWHFPGGGVEWNETLETALFRELEEETGVVPQDAPVLHGVFANFKRFPGDHIAIFIVRSWRQTHIPKPNAEIVEQGFFALKALPGDTVPGARNRIAEVFHNQGISPYWQ